MKKIGMILVMMAFVFGLSSTAHAIPFYDYVNFDDELNSAGSAPAVLDGETYSQLRDTDADLSYLHTIDFDPMAASINSAVLTLRHRGNQADDGAELWLLNAANEDLFPTTSYYLGDLIFSNGIWKTQTFDLNPAMYADLQNVDQWKLRYSLAESTGGTDGLKVAWLSLGGDYSPVPEPTTIFLLGSGLVGFVLRRKKA